MMFGEIMFCLDLSAFFRTVMIYRPILPWNCSLLQCLVFGGLSACGTLMTLDKADNHVVKLIFEVKAIESSWIVDFKGQHISIFF